MSFRFSFMMRPMILNSISSRTLVNVSTGLVATGIPVGYLARKHVKWQRPGNGQKRMAVHQGVFWGTFLISLWLIHRSFRVKSESALTNLFARVGYGGTAGLLPILGFEWGAKLGVAFYPYPKPALRRYTPSYLNQTY
jgi:hypothetical protein